MPTNNTLSEKEKASFADKGGLKKRTVEDRKRDADYFYRQVY